MKIHSLILLIVLYFLSASCTQKNLFMKASVHDLHFETLSRTWENGVPLGNGILGQLIWQKGSRLRFSLDRADLWDLRPTGNHLHPARMGRIPLPDCRSLETAAEFSRRLLEHFVRIPGLEKTTEGGKNCGHCH